MKYWTLSILLGLTTTCFSQATISISNLHFNPTIGSKQLMLNEISEINNEEVIISNFKFYLTDLCFYENNTLVHVSKTNAYLIDASNISSLIISEEVPKIFNHIKFKIGVDSITNVSGVLEGDLDPMMGMYWTWQSGYINFKLEGTSPSCPARKNKFQWHIGGYRYPYDTQREISLNVDSAEEIKIDIQLENILKEVDISKFYNVLSPGEAAFNLADEFAKLFKISK